MARKDKKKKKDETLGWDAEDADEAKEAEALKGTQMDKGHVDLYDRDKGSAGIETYDEDTGQLEGRIILKDGNQEGLLAVVKIVEEVKVAQDHAGAITGALEFTGKLNVENPSTVDRIWDIDITLANIESTNLGSPDIKIKELGTDESNNIDTRDFQISGEAKNLMLIKEYINTLPDADDILNINDIETDLLKLKEGGVAAEVTDDTADTDDTVDADDTDTTDDDEEETWDDGGSAVAETGLESYGISIDKDNIVTFAIAIRSLFEAPVSNVKVVKTVPDVFTNIIINDTTVGMAELEGNQVIWNIDELTPETTGLLKFSGSIYVSDIVARKTGLIEITYDAASSFAEGLGIEKFDAYTRNRFYIDTIEKDDSPGIWDCSLVFENNSEFIVELFNADVYTPEDETNKLIDIDPNDVPKLPAGAQWHSKSWGYESDEFPAFRKKLEFRVVPDFQTTVSGSISISDVELSIASITGEIAYDITQVPTFKTKDVIASLKLVNNGSAPLNEITIMQQTFSDSFQPPTAEEITLKLDAAEVELAAESVGAVDNVLTIALKDLKDSSTGMFKPESTLELEYPIHCVNPAQDNRFESEVIYLANTLPISQELEFRPEPVPIIEALHIRRKFRIGKEVQPIGDLGQYKIVLLVENIGNMAIQDLSLMDRVPDNFEYGTYSMQPEITDEVGSDTLKWTIDTLEEGEKLEISYEITGSGEYSASDAQAAY
jgi:hypothetical protein